MRFEREIGNFTVVDHCKADLAVQVNELLVTLDELHEQRPKFQEGTTIRFGWSKLRLTIQGRDLTVCEPDFSGSALKNVVPEVDRTLRIIRAQAAICNLAGAIGPETYFDQTILVAKAHIKAPHIYLDRREANNANVSGWYLGPVGASSAPTENDLELLYTFQLVSLRPALLKTLCLPVNYLVVFD